MAGGAGLLGLGAFLGGTKLGALGGSREVLTAYVEALAGFPRDITGNLAALTVSQEL